MPGSAVRKYWPYIHQPRPEERALARVSKDGHKRDRARGYPSRRPREERGLLRMRSEGWIRSFDGIDSWNRSTTAVPGRFDPTWSSCAGLTRASITCVKPIRSGWTRGSSPRVTAADGRAPTQIDREAL